MEQLSMFSDEVRFPLTYDDVESLYRKYIFEGETDDDVFTYSEINRGRSYSFYGYKFIEFYPGSFKEARIGLLEFDAEGKKKFKKRKPSEFSVDQIASYLDQLKDMKRKIFRSLIIEQFACCNDFIACSDAGHCLHEEDRFYNGCYYRNNLEAGKIFYGKNKNN